jgi:ketosteroid isomerase-like protein
MSAASISIDQIDMRTDKIDFVAAESGIRQLQARCIDSVWRKDFTAFGDCFTEDAQWRIAGRLLKGRNACVAFLSQVMPHIHRVLITMQTPILEVAGAKAIGRTYLTETNARHGRPAVFPIGIYYDRFELQGDRWRFAWHHYQSYYFGPNDLSGPFADFTDYGPPFGMPGPDDPAPPSLAFEA